MPYLLQLVIILLLTKLGAHLSNIFNFPSVIGELLVGVLADRKSTRLNSSHWS